MGYRAQENRAQPIGFLLNAEPREFIGEELAYDGDACQLGQSFDNAPIFEREIPLFTGHDCHHA